MKTIQFALIAITGLLLVSCSENTNSDSNSNNRRTLLKHTILKDQESDTPIKTQVQLDVLISDTAINETKVRELLSSLYEKTITRTGFKYHTNPTNIFIYAYTTKQKAESGMGQWIGMISKSYSETEARINIGDTQLQSLFLKSIEKFGLSEKTRLEIWTKSIRIEDRAQEEADNKYPLDNVGITMEDIKRNGAYNEKLKEKYEKVLATEFGIDIAIIDSIGIEGLKKGWPFPQK